MPPLGLKKLFKSFGVLLKTLYQQIKFAIMGVEDVPTYYFNAYPGTELFNMLHKEGKIVINDEYFLSLASLSHYNLYPNNISYNESIGRYELYIYRMLGMIISYSLSYILRPKRILRTIKSSLLNFGGITKTISPCVGIVTKKWRSIYIT